MTRETQSPASGHGDAQRAIDPFFEGLPPIGKTSRVHTELEAAGSGAERARTPGLGNTVAEEQARQGHAGGAAPPQDPAAGRGPPGAAAVPDHVPATGPLLAAAALRTFGAEIAVETGVASPSGDGGSRGHALGGRAFVAAAAPDLVNPEDRQLIGHEVAHALQQRKGGGLDPAVLDAPRRAALEAEAVAAGHAFSAGRPFAVSGAAPLAVALFDDLRKQVVHMTLMAGGMLVLELDDHTRETVRTAARGQLPDGQYSFNTATRRVALSGPAQPNADQLEFNLPRDARLEGLPTIPLQVTGGLGGAHAGHRIEATPMLAVAVPGTRVTYRVGMDPEIGGSYDYRWYCINDPASVRDGIPPIVNGPNEPRWENAQWAVPGRHTVVCELTFHGEGVPPRTERLEFFQQVNTEQGELATAFDQSQAPDYVRFRAGVELHNLELGGGMQDQHAATGPSIQVAGTNPAVPGTAPNYAFNTYTIAPSPNARRFHWYARCASWDTMPTQSFFGFSRVQIEGEDAFELGSGGPTAQFIIAQRNRYTIVCDELDAQGHRLGRARYVQIVESQDQADERGQLQQYMQHADAAVATVAPEKQVGLRAVYLNRETGERVPMQLYAGPSASDPHRVVLVDLLPGVGRIEYGGPTIGDALTDFENGNAYPVGSMQVEVPANRSGLPTLSRSLVTHGESLWQTWSQRIGWTSLGLAAAGVISAAVGAEPVAAAFFIAAAGTGVASGGLSLYDRLQQAEPSPVGIALDVAGIAASVVGGATAFRALKVGTALTFTGATGRFLFYSGFATNAVSGLLITVEGVGEISRILDSQMPQGEKIGAIVRILASLAVQGSLLALSVRDTNQLRRRVAVMIGEEAAGALQVDVLHSLNLLDDDALRALRGLPHDRLLVFAEITRTSPTSAARLAQILEPGYLASLSENMRPRYQQLLTEVFDGTVTGAALDQRLQVLSEVAAIRSGLQQTVTGAAGTHLAIGQRNIAYGDFDIRLPSGQELRENVVSVSGPGASNDITGQVGPSLGGRTVVPEIVRSGQTFAPTEGRAFHDSERKLFEYILDRIEARIGRRLQPGTSYQGQGYSGRITVNTEMSPCDSCANVIDEQFKRMFGTDINVVVNYGVQYP
jgi:hypothetical protein